MAKKYGHIGQVAQPQAVAWLEHVPEPKPEATDDAPPLEPTAETVN